MKRGKTPTPYSQPKFLITFTIVMGLFAVIRHGFSIDIPMQINASAVSEEVMDGDGEEICAQEKKATVILKEDTPAVLQEEDVLEEEEGGLVHENDALILQKIDRLENDERYHDIRGVWSYANCFPDIQDVQIRAAQKYGIHPVHNRKEAEKLVKSHKLVNICHSPFYTVDSLTHSIPYLVPRAQHLLNTICLNFLDSCLVKGLPPHLPMVTSVLRTIDDVSNLQQGNKNATTNSCHCYGTTVDIAYNRFMPVTGVYYSNSTLLRWNEPMKQVLAEVLYDLRREQQCYVKYERKQGCFHLTCR